MDISGLLWEVPVAQKVGIMFASLLFAFHGCSSLVGFIHSAPPSLKLWVSSRTGRSFCISEGV